MLAPQAEANRAHEFFTLTCQSRDMYPAFAAALLDETGIDIELETTGTLTWLHWSTIRRNYKSVTSGKLKQVFR